METPLISVIVPVYNSELFLSKCLSSIINNTYNNLEIICVNDGSTDKSYEILNEFANKDSRIHIINKINGGSARARNEGLNIAKGKYIAFIDSDDIISLKYFDFLMKCVLETKADIVYCDYLKFKDEKIIKEDIQLQPYKHITNIYRDRGCRQWVWGRLFSKEIIGSLQFRSDVSIFDDVIFTLEVLGNSRDINIYFLNNKLYFYRVFENSLSNSVSEDKWWNLLSSIYPRKDLFKNNIVLIMQMFKYGLVYRWYLILVKDKEKLNYINKMLINYFKILKDSKKFSIVEIVGYYLVMKFPFLYRQFKLKYDRTLYIWEKKIRNRKEKVEK